MGPHCTETHSHGTSLYRDPPHTCSNLFNLDLTVQGPPPLPDMFKLVHYAVCMLQVLGSHPTGMLSCYCPPMKLRERNVFSCLSTKGDVPCDHYPGCIGLHCTGPLYRVQAPPTKHSKCKLLGKLTKNHVIKDSYTYYKYEKNEHLRKKTLINAMLFIDLPIVERYYNPFLLGYTHVFRAPHIKYTCHCQ